MFSLECLPDLSLPLSRDELTGFHGDPVYGLVRQIQMKEGLHFCAPMYGFVARIGDDLSVLVPFPMDGLWTS